MKPFRKSYDPNVRLARIERDVENLKKRPVMAADVPFPGGITEIDSTDGAIVVADPTGPTTYLTAFKPLLEWATGSFSLTGPGAVGGAADFAHASFSNILDYTVPDQPKPLYDGWYQAMLTVRYDGLADGDVVSANLYTSIFGPPPSAFARSSITTGGDIAPLNAAQNISLPTMPMTTTDSFTGVGAVSSSVAGPFDVTFDLLVSLVRPGVP